MKEDQQPSYSEKSHLVDLGLRQYLSEGKYIWSPDFLDEFRKALQLYLKPLIAIDLDGVLRKSTQQLTEGRWEERYTRFITAIKGVDYLRKCGFPVVVWTSSVLGKNPGLQEEWSGCADGLISFQNYTCRGIDVPSPYPIPDKSYKYFDESERFGAFQVAVASARWLARDHFEVSPITDNVTYYFGMLKTPEVLSPNGAILIDDGFQGWDPRFEPTSAETAKPPDLQLSPDGTLRRYNVRSRNSRVKVNPLFNLEMAKVIVQNWQAQEQK